MRSEKEMFDLILSTAESDPRVRAVYLNGSRANPAVQKDRFQDFDIVYVVDEYETFLKEEGWFRVFGEILIMQEPDSPLGLPNPESDPKNRYAYLMQFCDGNRIDLSIIRKEIFLTHFLEDRLTVPLLDKDGFLPQIPPPDDCEYHVKKPTEIQVAGAANEFWWVATYIAKGLARGEILYAVDHLNFYVRPELLKMLGWYAGILTNFSVSVGKTNKYLERYLPGEIWDKLIKTYAPAETDAQWQALFATCALFEKIHPLVAGHFGYPYDPAVGQGVTAYLRDAKEDPR